MFSREGEQDHTISNEKGLEVLGDCGRQKLFDVISEFYQYTDLLLGTHKPNSAHMFVVQLSLLPESGWSLGMSVKEVTWPHVPYLQCYLQRWVTKQLRPTRTYTWPISELLGLCFNFQESRLFSAGLRCSRVSLELP